MNNENRPWIIVKHDYPTEIVYFIDEVFEIHEVRGVVDRQDGIVFIIHTNEKNHPDIPHVHAKYGKYEISISIFDGKILAGNLPKKNQKKAVDWVIRHKKEFLSEWKDIAITASSMLTVSELDNYNY